MSRIGKQPIQLPDGVDLTMEHGEVVVTGPKGALRRSLPAAVRVLVDGRAVKIEPQTSERRTPALWGLSRALVANMVTGVSQGFQKKLELEGIGYRAAIKGRDLELLIGFSHPVIIPAPEDIEFRVEKNTITISGADKERVGDAAARIRRVRPPEPYKGKGIRYSGEVIRRKAGKKAVTGASL